MSSVDVVIVGGSIAGASLAKSLREKGFSVILLEMTREFHDRARGECIQPWGAMEAQQLGVLDALLEVGSEMRHANVRFGVPPVVLLHSRRDFLKTTTVKMAGVSFQQHLAQERLLQLAVASGVDVIREAMVTQATLGEKPSVTFVRNGQTSVVEAKLIVGADGANSTIRSQMKVGVERMPAERVITGVLATNLDHLDLESNSYGSWNNLEKSLSALWIRLKKTENKTLVRLYISYPRSLATLRGKGDFQKFLSLMNLCDDKEAFSSAKIEGPLFSNLCSTQWSNSVVGQNVALVGDASIKPDPTFGQGMALALRDVRVLSDALKRFGICQQALEEYHVQQSVYGSVIRTVEQWHDELLFSLSDEAKSRRSHALEAIISDPQRRPDHLHSGPECSPLQHDTKARFFGLDIKRAA